jgi:hypothetical protein
MNKTNRAFGVNTYSYTFRGNAAETVARLADQGYGGVELMFFPGHLRPEDMSASDMEWIGQFRQPLVAACRCAVEFGGGTSS